MAMELPLDPTEVSERLAGAAECRNDSAFLRLRHRMGMSPNDAARDEFDCEASSYQGLGAIEMFSNRNPRVPPDQIWACPVRAEYVQRRAEAIRQQRESNIVANLATVERAIGRPLTDSEREAMKMLLEAPVAKAERPWRGIP